MLHHYNIEDEDLLLRPIEEKDIETVRMWRNTEAIRKSFIYQQPISPAQQKQWYLEYLSKANDFMFMIEFKSKAVGTVALYNIDLEKNEAEFGRLMIGELSARGVKLGERVTGVLSEFGFTELQLETIILEVFSNNTYAKNAYEAIGFQIEGKREVNDREVLMMRLQKGDRR